MIGLERGRFGRRTWFAGAASLLAQTASGNANDTRPHSGQKVVLSVLGIADRHPSTLVRAMAPGFVACAKSAYGYDVDIRYQDAPAATLYAKAAASLGHSTEFNLVIADSAWLDAFASRKLILPLNPIIRSNKELEVAWYAPQIRQAYQLFPDGSDNRWAVPQSGDVVAMFVRRDWLEAPGENQAFRTKYATDLPKCWEDFEKLTWDDYVKVLDFFNRPDQDRHAFASHLSAACDALCFIFGHGGRAWDQATGQVEGVLNTDANAKALEHWLSLRKYRPDMVRAAGMAEWFTQGKLLSALQWASAGASMIPRALQDKVIVVPPPGFRAADEVVRHYVIGGQTWVLNDSNDAMQTQICVDFLKWWYQPETALEFARLGGLPCDETTLSRPDFAAIQPWFRTYRAMLPHSRFYWHDPAFTELLAVLQSAFAAYAAGKVTDARLVLDLVACRQQTILFREGSAERRPSEACQRLQH